MEPSSFGGHIVGAGLPWAAVLLHQRVFRPAREQRPAAVLAWKARRPCRCRRHLLEGVAHIGNHCGSYTVRSTITAAPAMP